VHICEQVLIKKYSFVKKKKKTMLKTDEEGKFTVKTRKNLIQVQNSTECGVISLVQVQNNTECGVISLVQVQNNTECGVISLVQVQNNTECGVIS
jgi:hypothetical protein